MKKRAYITVVGLFLAVLFCGADAFCERVRTVQRLNDSGDVRGVVECPRGTPVEGALVYIPGHSFMARTDDQGSFNLFSIPESFYPYTLSIELLPDSVFMVNDILIQRKRVTNLGTIVACSNGCEDNSVCPNGYYCEKAVGDCDGKGVCARKPRGTYKYMDPVCGCDGVTYMNKEKAAKEGVTIASYGPCENQNPCHDNSDCAPGYYCAKEEGDCDGDGTCREKPTAWIEIYAPVCGCDGNTYSNSAEAAGYGVNVAYPGECSSQ